MSTQNRSLADVTLGDLGRGLARYRPFVLTVAAVVLVTAFLPGKHKGSVTSSSQFAAGSGLAGTNGVGAGRGAVSTANSPGGESAAGLNGAGGGPGSTGASGASFSSSAAGALSGTIPAPTVDPWCDPGTGRVKLPSLYAAPCVPPWDGTNPGATFQGVTATTITIAVPVPQTSAAVQAILVAGGDTDNNDQRKQQRLDYVNLFEHHLQTYGRKVKLVFFTSNVNPNDRANPAAQNSEAQADAIYVAKQIKAFASLGDGGDPFVYEDTLVANHVICICTVTLPASYYLKRAPYIWGTGLPDETQDFSMRAEMICDEINPFPPTFAGEADLNYPLKKQRTYAILWPGDPSNNYKPGADFFVARLKQECGITPVDVTEYQLSDIFNPGQAQEEAQTDMAKFKTDGASEVVCVCDPITPIYFTSAATKQNYFPEWINMGSALTDTTFFGRLYDPNQEKHNFGFSALPDRIPKNVTDPYNLHYWQFGTSPSAPNEYGVIYPPAWDLMLGINLAGPTLTPQTFQCGEPPFTSKTFEGQPCVGRDYPGMFGYPISPTNWRARVANPVITFGDHLWAWDDYNQSDDGTLIWWDPNATGQSETGSEGQGMFRYVNLGKRYMYGQFPKGQIPWFNPANTVTVWASLPAADTPPSYKYACYYLCNSPGN